MYIFVRNSHNNRERKGAGHEEKHKEMDRRTGSTSCVFDCRGDFFLLLQHETRERKK